LRDKPFKKDYFQLFPSVFLSYQLTENDQLQLNYTRRLRRPWGGQLNSFRNTRDASMVEFGNPELTPEFSNSFSLNYLRTWTQHSLLVSAYYRPTTDVMQRIRWQSSTDGMMYQTSKNVAKSLSTGLEVVLKNKFFRILDLTTTANAYYYKINGFSYVIDGQTVTGDENHNFTWNARMQASIILPYDITVQLSGRYRARQVITQGYRKSNFSMEMGIKKNFFNRQLVVSLNCRDLLNSRKWKTYTSGDTFTRYQENWRRGRTVNLTVTWNFGNMTPKRPKEEERRDDGQDDLQQQDNRGGFNAGAAGGGDD
jgi:outer membrane receptor protein involved in Fe transport